MHHHRKLILNDSFRFLSLAWFSDEPCGLLIEVYSIVTRLHIILADDDPDECMIFTQCLEEVAKVYLRIWKMGMVTVMEMRILISYSWI